MNEFQVLSHCFLYGHMEYSARQAAPIMGVTIKTAQNYLNGKTKTDPVRLKMLQLTMGKKIIDEKTPIWFNEGCIYTDGGQYYSGDQINNFTYLSELDKGSIRHLRTTIAALKTTIKKLTAHIDKLSPESRLPDNVIPFPTPTNPRKIK